MQVMVRIIKLERVFSFMFDSLFEGMYKTSAREADTDRLLYVTNYPEHLLVESNLCLRTNFNDELNEYSENV